MAELTDREEKTLTTPFGEPSGPYVLATLRGKRVAFLARHGKGIASTRASSTTAPIFSA
jgi:5'-methylthioadenosine phosphorylase